MQVLPALNSGGVERGAVDVANFILKSGFKSIIVSSGGGLQSFLNKSVKHIKLNVSSKNPFIIFSNIKKLRKLIIENDVDILHVRSRAPAWSSYFAVKGTKCKLLTTMHGTHSLNLTSKSESKLKKKYNAVMLKGSRIIAVSNFIKNHIKEHYPEYFDDKKITVVHRGVDVEIFDPARVSKEAKVQLIQKWQIPDDKKIIMLPGRVTFWKGHEFLIDSLKLLNRDDYLCLFVGDFAAKTGYKKKLEAKIVQSGLEGKCMFVGNSNSMTSAYSICDVIISASVEPEAFGRVAVEAQAMEKIIIATNIGGSRETVINNETGFVVEPNNAKEMADNIDKVLSISENERHLIGLKARKNVVDNFSNDLMYGKTLEIYQDLLK